MPRSWSLSSRAVISRALCLVKGAIVPPGKSITSTSVSGLTFSSAGFGGTSRLTGTILSLARVPGEKVPLGELREPAVVLPDAMAVGDQARTAGALVGGQRVQHFVKGVAGYLELLLFRAAGFFASMSVPMLPEQSKMNTMPSRCLDWPKTVTFAGSTFAACRRFPRRAGGEVELSHADVPAIESLRPPVVPDCQSWRSGIRAVGLAPRYSRPAAAAARGDGFRGARGERAAGIRPGRRRPRRRGGRAPRRPSSSAESRPWGRLPAACRANAGRTTSPRRPSIDRARGFGQVGGVLKFVGTAELIAGDDFKVGRGDCPDFRIGENRTVPPVAPLASWGLGPQKSSIVRRACQSRNW